MYKTQQKDLHKKADLEADHQMVQHQINHFDKMKARYKNIFQAISHRDKKIQDQYKNLTPEKRNLALAENDRDKSIEDLVNRQTLINQRTYDYHEQQKTQRKLAQMSYTKQFNNMNIQYKMQK